MIVLPLFLDFSYSIQSLLQVIVADLVAKSTKQVWIRVNKDVGNKRELLEQEYQLKSQLLQHQLQNIRAGKPIEIQIEGFEGYNTNMDHSDYGAMSNPSGGKGLDWGLGDAKRLNVEDRMK